MERSNYGPNGMVVTPHHLATQSAVSILREGGTAMEAVISAAATIAVVYPHMNSIGGDGFWLIIPPHEDPFVIEACGAAGALANLEFFKGLDKIPYKGPKSAITVAGTVGGWQEALDYVSECGYQRKSTSRLLSDAIEYAENGYAVTLPQVNSIKDIKESKKDISRDFADIFFPDRKVPKVGDRCYQKNLAKTLKHLAENGFKSFYRGQLAKQIADDMASVGMPITEADLANFTTVRKRPLRLIHSQGELLNTPPPTQGAVSLATLGILDKLKIDGKDEVEFIHATVEATKQAFRMRDKYITDPKFMNVTGEALITDREIRNMTQKVDLNQAGYGKGRGPGDTVWIGVMDKKGFSVSFIQSIYHNFGSEVVLPRTGILWHNRGVSFTLDENKLLSLKPGKKPFHTLNPAAAKLRDGRHMIYGTRGGDGQSQTQAAVFHRYVIQGMTLQKSISEPRWLYGRNSGDDDDTLKLEARFSKEIQEELKKKGHDIVLLPDYCERVGQAGAIVRHSNGMMEGAFDPRSDGSASGF